MSSASSYLSLKSLGVSLNEAIRRAELYSSKWSEAREQGDHESALRYAKRMIPYAEASKSLSLHLSALRFSAISLLDTSMVYKACT